jgi:hypothetical protein
MSVGIILLNKHGIALAADSALTVGDREAIFNSTNKMFRLGKNNPIGIVVYGNLELMGTPIDIIIDHYSHHLDSNNIKFPNTKGYLDGLIKFLIGNQDKFKFKDNERNFMLDFIDEFLSKFKKLLKEQMEILEREEKIREQIDFDGEIYSRTYKVYKSIISGHTPYTTFKISEDFKSRNFELFKEKIKEFDKDIHELFIKDYFEIFIDSLNREMNYAMGFAIAGYGEDEVYPSVYHISLSGVIDNQVRYRIKNDYVVDNISTRWIEVLAQDDVIETYIDGISPKIKRSIVENFVSSMIKKIEDEDIDFLAQKQKRLIMEKIIDASIDFETKLNAQVKNNWAPIFQSISASPMLDLISFAENMVNLTSLKRKFALDENNMTVGGPVDVACITKFDGFSWVKKKGKTQE